MLELERSDAAGKCQACGAPYGHGMRFCPQCGRPGDRDRDPGGVVRPRWRTVVTTAGNVTGRRFGFLAASSIMATSVIVGGGADGGKRGRRACCAPEQPRGLPAPRAWAGMPRSPVPEATALRHARQGGLFAAGGALRDHEAVGASALRADAGARSADAAAAPHDHDARAATADAPCRAHQARLRHLARQPRLRPDFRGSSPRCPTWTTTLVPDRVSCSPTTRSSRPARCRTTSRWSAASRPTR